MPIYHVVWTIEVSARDIREAAGKALLIQRDPRNTNTLFEVAPIDTNDYHQIEVDPLLALI